MNMNDYPLSEKTRNLVRFCRHTASEALDDSFAANFAFRDAASGVSVLKSTKTAPGPDECFFLHDLDPRPVFVKLLGLDVEFPNQPAADHPARQPYNSMNYYRSHIEEIFYVNGTRPLPPMEGTCLLYFAGADRLVIEYRLHNPSDADVPVRLRWRSEPTLGPETRREILPSGFLSSSHHKVTRTPYRVNARLVAEAADIRFQRDGENFVSDWLERRIPPHETIRIVFRADFDVEDAPRPASPPVPPDEALALALRQAEDAYARLPALPPAVRSYERLALKAVGTLRSLRHAERLPDGRDVVTIHAGKCGSAATWFWDTAFALLGLGLAGDTETARGAIRILLAGIRPDGTPPGKFQCGQYRMFHQQPILAWGVGHFLARCPDAAFLRECHEPLARYVRHWLTRWDRNGNGLVEFPDTSCCWDDALRWHTGFPIAPRAGGDWARQDWGGMSVPSFESVDTNTHLVLECRTLARMAQRLGQADEAREWERQAGQLAERINAQLFNDADGIYQDRAVADGRFTGIVTPASFMPLYAGIAPADRAQRLCREVLLNPDRFYTPFPFPTLDRSHPAFRSGGFLYASPDYPGALVPQAYWIGRAWPHISFWMVGALHRAGLAAEADAAAGRILEAMDRQEGIYECYDSLTGTGNGHPEFMWSAAAVLALVHQLYRRDPVGTI